MLIFPDPVLTARVFTHNHNRARFYYRRNQSSGALAKNNNSGVAPGAPVAQPDTAESGATDQS